VLFYVAKGRSLVLFSGKGFVMRKMAGVPAAGVALYVVVMGGAYAQGVDSFTALLLHMNGTDGRAPSPTAVFHPTP